MSQKDYKDSLILPKTDFPMRANLKEKDSYFFKFWNDLKLYEKVLEKNKNNQAFILHDGPPYANGSLHIGHALNKILKDIVVRYKSLNGFYTPFVPGWDTHGLPIENKMLAEMKLAHTEMDTNLLRAKAAQYAESQILIQKEQFQKLNLLADFKKIYKSLDPNYEAKQLEIFSKLALKKLIFRALKPVYWSPSSQSALAEAEVEYKNHRSPSIYVAFNIVENHNDKIKKNDKLIIWTTTPWTLLANAGVAISEKIKYAKIRVESNFFIVAFDLIEKLAIELKWDNWKIIDIFEANELVKSKYLSPLNNNICPVVYGHHVNLESGSGLVHMAPLFGEDDFLIGKKENLAMIMHVADDGKLNQSSSMFSGLFYEDANKEIGLFLESQNQLLSLKFIKHSYPHDWRTGKPIIYRGTPQWFVKISDIKKDIIKSLDNVSFYNDWAKKRLTLMLENREEWTISRQRSWGVPIIIFYDQDKNPIIEKEIFDYVINLVRKYGSDIWYQKDADELLPPKYRNKNFTKELDIMDVWFDSGSSFYAADIADNICAPYDLYLEGSDQYRGWFNSSLINSVAIFNKSPYKALVSHGFVLDEKGNKMSKSKGNVINPEKIISQFGSDILRLWVANSEYFSDISIGSTIISQNIEMYRKIRNTLRHMIGSLDDYDYSNPAKEDLDLLIFERLENLKITIKKYYEKYNFISIIKEINNFITYLSAFYLSVIKDTLYLESKNDSRRRSIQHNLYLITKTLLIALAPILPTTCEEAYSYFKKENKKVSIHLEEFFIVAKKYSYEHENIWKEFFDFKNTIYKEIEIKIQAGIIKRSNEAFVKAPIKSKFLAKLNLKDLLMVGKIENSDTIEILKFDSIKCIRCWNHFEINKIVEGLCQRCLLVLKSN